MLVLIPNQPNILCPTPCTGFFFSVLKFHTANINRENNSNAIIILRNRPFEKKTSAATSKQKCIHEKWKQNNVSIMPQKSKRKHCTQQVGCVACHFTFILRILFVPPSSDVLFYISDNFWLCRRVMGYGKTHFVHNNIIWSCSRAHFVM